MGCHFEVKFFQTQNEVESFMPFPRFMLMRGSLRGNGNHSLDNPLEQDQAAASTSPAWRNVLLPIGTQPPGCITCVLRITHPCMVLAADFYFGESLALLWHSVEKNHREQVWFSWLWRTAFWRGIETCWNTPKPWDAGSVKDVHGNGTYLGISGHRQ